MTCGIVYDTEGRALRIAGSALACVLPRGHAGPHDCAYVARLTIANTGPTRPRDSVTTAYLDKEQP